MQRSEELDRSRSFRATYAKIAWTWIKRPCECTIAHDISLENVSRMHELSEAFHAISLRHTCLMSILEQFSKLSSRAGDLSFNKLNGEIPNLDGLTNVQVMCLTGNRLNGNILDGIKGRQSRTNLFKSFFEEGNLELGGCLENYPCQKNRYSLHINCGGEKSTVGNVVYEGDQYEGDGNYTVKIHFAEIIIRGNKSFHSLGRHIFNVYIQGKLESEDFDIVQAAQGVEKVVVKEFKAVVKNKTLEVRFHWASKGTTAIPSRGTYGPLILAISVESDNLWYAVTDNVIDFIYAIHPTIETLVVDLRKMKHNGMLLLIMLLLLFMLLIQLLWRNMEVVVEKVLMHDFIIRYNVMAPTLGLVSYLPILETYFINNLARVRSLQLELKSRIEEFEKLDKFHMEQMEEEVTARNAHIHQQKVGSLECFMVAKSSAEEFSKIDIVEAWTH
ncbi:hypothetical protein VitviT2T_006978 [Vitis vinifera]|uniref:Malectin domain-containing protein n=1 Tax=Vitis vinifera TaxID=29760 RepID=A0ABY9BYL9_VITVI|nr:hypothetical protein VitviT2T_006978 [Vitis vinifera]